MKFRYVTSMSLRQFDDFGEKMLQGLVDKWPEGEILCYSEDKLPEVKGVTVKNLYDVPGCKEFCAAVERFPLFRGEIGNQYNYRFNVAAFSKKIFAEIDAACGHDSYLFWVDADVVTDNAIPRFMLEEWMLGNFMCVMRRKTWHLCSSFVGWDCGHTFANSFFNHYYSLMMTGNVFLLQEWHDAFILQSVIENMQGVKDLGENINGEGPYNVFDDVFKGFAHHLKGNLKTKVFGKRYAQLFDIAAQQQPKRFLEIGVWRGDRGIDIHNICGAEYIGHDLFEDASETTDEKEKNVKKHYTKKQVEQRLVDAGVKHRLYKGFSHKTLPQYIKEYGKQSADLIFIDGGHSVRTIKEDYKYAKQIIRKGGFIVFDDYYSGMPNKELKKYGAQAVLKKVPHFILPIEDDVAGGGKVQMAVVQC